jgi:putative salt-induced outer membrane protein
MILRPLPASAADGPVMIEIPPAGRQALKLDPAVRQMIEIAIASGDQSTARNVLAVARQVSPDAASEIDALEDEWKASLAMQAAQAERVRVERLHRADFFKNWKGELELGAYRSTGNSRDLGMLGSLKLNREGLEWTHRLAAKVELRQSDGETSAERILASWQPGYRFQERAYAFGLAQYEHDPFASYDGRYTLGGGLGYRPINRKGLLLELEGGPAFRRVEEMDGPIRNQIVGRGSLNLDWQISPTLKFKHKTDIYLEAGYNNATATTAIDTTVIGNLQARFSYDVQYEEGIALGARNWNTQSRATFVYSF